jgi:hypothetical protein
MRLELFADYDPIVDGSDNSRHPGHLVNDAAAIVGKPNVWVWCCDSMAR